MHGSSWTVDGKKRNTGQRMIKLTIELVPEPLWGKSLKNLLPKTEWDKVRKEVYATHKHKCEVCDAKGKLICHEVWHYNDKTCTAELRGLVALCEMCNHVKHIGLAGILAREGKLDFDKVIAHFKKVNECDIEMLISHHAEAASQWETRSGIDWNIQLSKRMQKIFPGFSFNTIETKEYREEEWEKF